MPCFDRGVVLRKPKLDLVARVPGKPGRAGTDGPPTNRRFGSRLRQAERDRPGLGDERERGALEP